MKKKIAKKLTQRKRNIRKRLDKRSLPENPRPMLNPGKIHYEMADRIRGITCGGIGDVSCLNPEGKISTPNIDRLAAPLLPGPS